MRLISGLISLADAVVSLPFRAAVGVAKLGFMVGDESQQKHGWTLYLYEGLETQPKPIWQRGGEDAFRRLLARAQKARPWAFTLAPPGKPPFNVQATDWKKEKSPGKPSILVEHGNSRCFVSVMDDRREDCPIVGIFTIEAPIDKIAYDNIERVSLAYLDYLHG